MTSTTQTTLENELLFKVTNLTDVIKKKDVDILQIQGELLREQQKVAEQQRRIDNFEVIQEELFTEKQKVTDLQLEIDNLLLTQREVADLQGEIHSLQELNNTLSENEKTLQKKVDEQRKKINELLAKQAINKGEKADKTEKKKNHFKVSCCYIFFVYVNNVITNSCCLFFSRTIKEDINKETMIFVSRIPEIYKNIVMMIPCRKFCIIYKKYDKKKRKIGTKLRICNNNFIKLFRAFQIYQGSR